MNSIHRAISFCPTCFSQQEVWFVYGQVSPTDSVSCFTCETVYPSSQFILKLLELRNDVTVSAIIPVPKT